MLPGAGGQPAAGGRTAADGPAPAGRGCSWSPASTVPEAPRPLPQPAVLLVSAIFTSLLNTEYVYVETNVFLNISSYDSVLKLFSFLINLRNKLY